MAQSPRFNVNSLTLLDRRDVNVFRRESSDEFLHSRECNPWDRQTRAPVFLHPTYTRPRHGQWPGLQEDDPAPTSKLRGRAFANPYPPSANSNNRQARAVRAVRPLILSIHPFSANFVRLLAWGGEGVVALFDSRDQFGNNERFFVVKGIVTEGQPIADANALRRAFRREKRMLEVFTLRTFHTYSRQRLTTQRPYPELLCSRHAHCSNSPKKDGSP